MTDERKINILDDFVPRVRNMELELKSSYERMESMIGLIYAVGTQILNLLWVSILFDTVLILQKNVQLKIWFLN